MRYLLSWHIHEAEMLDRSPAWREEVVAFLAQFEDELFAHSELDWVEVLDPESRASSTPGSKFVNRGRAPSGPSGRLPVVYFDGNDQHRRLNASR